MPLNREEIDSLVTKLREKYRDYAKKHSPAWFNIDSFEQRLGLALRNRMNLEGFILAEISNFEKLREQYDKKKKQKENSFSKEVDRIIEENTARIKKYPSRLFHPRCSAEISHFYGALNIMAEDYFPVFRLLAPDDQLKKNLESIEIVMQNMCVPAGSRNPRRIDDHILLLNRQAVREIEIEKDGNEYLKEGAFILHDIIDLCERILESPSDSWNYPVTFQKLYIEEIKKRKVIDAFSGMTGFGAILKVKDYAAQVIEDFRLSAFRRQG
ncbi:MAG TPA: hypothetical protein PK986_07915 [Spirochaetota bacterium]|nr:hypothetical protein [Spirochaetota bacterium]